MSTKYTLVPREEGVFLGVDLMSRNVFGLIYDRWKLSNRFENMDAFTDAQGTYCVYDRADLAADLGVSLPTVRKAIKFLIDKGLLRAKRAGPCAAWRYYITMTALYYLDDSMADMIGKSIDPDEL